MDCRTSGGAHDMIDMSCVAILSTIISSAVVVRSS